MGKYTTSTKLSPYVPHDCMCVIAKMLFFTLTAVWNKIFEFSYVILGAISRTARLMN